MTNAGRNGLSPRQFYTAAKAAKEQSFTAKWQPDSPRKLVDDYAAVYDEMTSMIDAVGE